MELIDSYMMDAAAFYTVCLEPGFLMDVKVCCDTGLTYIMENEDGSTVYDQFHQDITFPFKEYDEQAVIQFVKESHALYLINEAIKLGVLHEGPNGGVMVYKRFEDNSEGWREVDKGYAAADLVKQDMVHRLSEKIASSNHKPVLDDHIVLDFGNIVSELETKNLKLLKVKDNNGLFVVDREGNLYGIETYYAGGYLDRFIGEKFVISFELMEQPTRDFEDWRKEFLDAAWVNDFIDRVVKKEYPGFKTSSLDEKIQSASTRAAAPYPTDSAPAKAPAPER